MSSEPDINDWHKENNIQKQGYRYFNWRAWEPVLGAEIRPPLFRVVWTEEPLNIDNKSWIIALYLGVRLVIRPLYRFGEGSESITVEEFSASHEGWKVQLLYCGNYEGNCPASDPPWSQTVRIRLQFDPAPEKVALLTREYL